MHSNYVSPTHNNKTHLNCHKNFTRTNSVRLPTVRGKSHYGMGSGKGKDQSSHALIVNNKFGMYFHYIAFRGNNEAFETN